MRKGSIDRVFKTPLDFEIKGKFAAPGPGVSLRISQILSELFFIEQRHTVDSVKVLVASASVILKFNGIF